MSFETSQISNNVSDMKFDLMRLTAATERISSQLETVTTLLTLLAGQQQQQQRERQQR